MSHGYHANTLGVFTGFAAEGKRDEGFALGLEYEHRFNAHFGVGALAEHTAGDIDAWVYALPFAYHSGPWKLIVAPGVEEADEGESESLLRLGVEYGFHRGDWEISPQLDVDFVDGEEIYVIGLVFARGF